MKQIAHRRFSVTRGISTIETLVVVMTLTAATSFAMFRVSNRPVNDPARECAQCFVSAVREARKHSIEKQSPVTFVLDQNSKPARWVFTASAGSHGTAAKWDLPINDAATVEGTAIPIRFDGSGNASYLGQWKFKSAVGYEVTLEPIGAKVSLKAMN